MELLKKEIEKFKKLRGNESNEEIINIARNLVDDFDLLYRKGEEVISDEEFDNIYVALEKAETDYPEYYDENSPTLKIKDVIIDELEKVEHKHFMGSQEKAKTEEDLLKFLKSIKGNTIIEHKYDGLTLVLEYENGIFTRGVTRGDGKIGEDVTHNVKTFKNIPLTIDYKGKLVVRSEGIIKLDDFKKLNLADSNPRNIVSGSVRTLDSSKARKRNLSLIAFGIVESDKSFQTGEQELEFLTEQGFEVGEYQVFEKQEAKELINYCLTFEKEKRQKLNYLIDGLVIKANDRDERENLGYKRKTPRWSIAYKFKSLNATTKLIDVIWNTGKTGKLAPKGKLEEVEIDGVKVNYVTLNNFDWIQNMGLEKGNKVMIERANDVIPKVIKVVSKDESEPIMTPSKCPSCQSPTEIIGSHIFCTNKVNCPAQIVNKIIDWCSKSKMDIRSLGGKTVQLLHDNGHLDNIVDLYTLLGKEEELIKIEGIGKRKLEKIEIELQKSKEKPFSKMIYGLSITNIGEVATEEFIQNFNSFEKIQEEMKDATTFNQKLLSLNDFGPTMAQSIINFFNNEENLRIIKELEKLGFQTAEKEEEITGDIDQQLDGMTFVITGTLSKPRGEFETEVKSLGGKVSKSISKNTDYLLAGEKAGSKLDKANKLGVKVLNEEEYLALIS